MTPGTAYTRERLAEAAARCSNMGEAIALLGVRPYRGLGSHLRKRFAAFGIDIAHFGSRRKAVHPGEKALATAVADAISYAEALRHLGLPCDTTTRRWLTGWIQEAGLSTAHFLGQGHQRVRPGTNPQLTAEQVLVLHDREYRTRTSMLRRALAEIGVRESCARCGTGAEWQGRPMTLEIDHINGDWRDDRRENLRLLCPNCHTLTATWCRGGRNNRPGRVVRQRVP
ncbi:HNH endonuclease [Streptomyces sp. CO7]